jgi:hypothetical protein
LKFPGAREARARAGCAAHPPAAAPHAELPMGHDVAWHVWSALALA